ncbi:unnamed protein product, partial [Rotaria sordida]
NVLAVILEIKYEKYKLGTEQGILAGYYSFYQLSKAPETAILMISQVTQGQCTTKRCKCKQSNVLCNSRCHNSTTCKNK